MAQPRTRDGSTTSMPDIGIPGHRNRNDTVGSQSGSSDSRSQTSRTAEERIKAIEVASVEGFTLVAEDPNPKPLEASARCPFLVQSKILGS